MRTISEILPLPATPEKVRRALPKRCSISPRRHTVLDFDPEEKKRQCSLSTAFAPLEWKDCKINLLDAPGKFDFEGGVYEAMRAAECALIVTSAGSGMDVGAEKAIKAADARGIAKFFAITKVDAENRDFYKTFEALKEEIGAKLCPVVVPHMVGGKAESYVNLCSGKAFAYKNGKATPVDMPSDPHFDEMKEVLMEAVASAARKGADTLYLVVHGGTIMAVMSSLTGKDYFDFNAPNGAGYIIDLETDDAGNVTASTTYDRFCGGLRAGSDGWRPPRYTPSDSMDR